MNDNRKLSEMQKANIMTLITFIAILTYIIL